MAASASPAHPTQAAARGDMGLEPAAPSARCGLCSPCDPTLAVGVGLSTVRTGHGAGGSFLPRDGPITGPRAWISLLVAHSFGVSFHS